MRAQVNRMATETFGAKKAGLISLGFVLSLLGVLSIGGAFGTTLLSVFILGVLLLFSAFFQFVFAFASGRWSGFAVHLMLSVLHAVLGVFFLLNPLKGEVTLTFVLSFYFISSGVMRLLSSDTLRYPKWGWAFFSGFVTTCLGLYTLLYLPEVSLFFVGTLVGIDLIFLGTNLMAVGFFFKDNLGLE